MSKSWHDGWWSCERAQHGQGVWQLWRTETRPAWLKGTEWGAEWCELGLEKQEMWQMDTPGRHVKALIVPHLVVLIEIYFWTPEVWDGPEPAGTHVTFLFSKTRVAAGSKKATVFCASCSGTRNNTKVIIICISNLFAVLVDTILRRKCSVKGAKFSSEPTSVSVICLLVWC